MGTSNCAVTKEQILEEISEYLTVPVGVIQCKKNCDFVVLKLGIRYVFTLVKGTHLTMHNLNDKTIRVIRIYE